MEPRLKIACVHTGRPLNGETVGAMNLIRFIRMSEALARRGHVVHVVVNGSIREHFSRGGPIEVRSCDVNWSDYDVVKTFFHSGYDALDAWGGGDHPFIISNLGSVVGSQDEEGVYFYGAVREALWNIQKRVASRSRVLSFLTQQNRALFSRMHGDRDHQVFVPCGVDAVIPEPAENPYAPLGIDGPVALFAGNIYTRDRQPEVNVFWQMRLNALGGELMRHGVRLVAMGPGERDLLDPAKVTHVGIVDYRDLWNWQWYAHVGVVLAQGAVQDNESSKIYYYLRTGLPVACEAPVPNAWLLNQTQHGAVVDYDTDLSPFAAATAALAHEPRDGRDVVRYMVDSHSWDARAAIYAPLLAHLADD